MALETATYIDALVTSNPDGSDQRSTADDHLRLIKAALKRSFPQIGGAVSASAVAISYVNDLSASAQAQLNALRDGTATALNAVSARFANSASLALNIGSVPAAQVPALNVGNVFTANQQIRGVQPELYFYVTGGATDEKLWSVLAAPSYFEACVRLDDQTFAALWLRVARVAGTVGAIDLYGTAINFNGSSLTNPVQLNGLAASDYARLHNPQTFTKGTGSDIVALSGTSLTPNCDHGNVFRLVFSGNSTMNAPSSPRSGQTIVFHLIQNAGSNTMSWNSVFKFAGSVAPTLSTAAGAVDVFAFNYDSTSGVWRQAGLNVG